MAAIVESVEHSPEMVAAAWLHDVVEDTPVRLDDIQLEFGSEVAKLVEELTDVSVLTDGNRETRRALDRAHSAKASAAGQTIKLADLIDNTKSIVAHDPGFAKVYLREKALLLDVLTRGDPTLMVIARGQMESARPYSPFPIHAMVGDAHRPRDDR